MRLAILAGVAVICASAAYGQVQIGRGNFEPAAPQQTPEDCHMPETAAREFVENLYAAQAALKARDGAGALGAAALARPHARSGSQLSAVTQLEVAAYHALRDEAALVEKLEAGIAEACMPGAVRKNYQQILDKVRAGGTAWPTP